MSSHNILNFEDIFLSGYCNINVWRNVLVRLFILPLYQHYQLPMHTNKFHDIIECHTASLVYWRYDRTKAKCILYWYCSPKHFSHSSQLDSENQQKLGRWGGTTKTLSECLHKLKVLKYQLFINIHSWWVSGWQGERDSLLY